MRGEDEKCSSDQPIVTAPASPVKNDEVVDEVDRRTERSRRQRNKESCSTDRSDWLVPRSTNIERLFYSF